MSDDLLRRASRALRDTAEGRSERAPETRARLLADARRSSRRRTRVLLFVVPLAAALAASSAWAAATGRISSVWHLVQPESEVASSARPKAGPAAAELSRALAQAAQTTGEPPAVPAISPAASTSSEPAASTSAAPSASVPAERDADHEAYLAAHRAHFGGGASEAALAGWDAYLRAHPSGRFAMEARYNRALCLVNLGRRAQAAQALEPFARGAYGTYRQAEAQALREALGTP